ncbi:MAG TPA: alkaline phosphatase D family protein [Kofleriaceae bacterium]
MAVLPAATWLVGCGDNQTADPSDAASAVFEIASDKFLVWVWAAAAGSAVVRVTDKHTTIQLADDSGVGVIDITNLTPGQRYTVTIELESGAVLGPHLVRTAPDPGDPVPVRLAVSADYDPHADQFASHVLDGVTMRAPDFFVSIGDFPYTDNGPAPVTIDEFRHRHLAARTHPPLRALHQACGCYSIYDDHEFTNNWDAMCAAANPQRLATALQAWDEFFPLRAAPPAVRYRNWRWGALVECFLLDCRLFRSADAAPDDATKTMLGAPQLAWFLSALAASTATFKIIFTSIPLDYTADNNDDWTSFTHERDQIFEYLLDHDISGVLFISGDQHWFASQSHAYGIREFQVGPLRRAVGQPPPPVPAVKFRYLGFNAGIIDVSADRVTVFGVGPDTNIFYEETLTLAELTPSRPGR